MTSLLSGLFGLHASFTFSDHTLGRVQSARQPNSMRVSMSTSRKQTPMWPNASASTASASSSASTTWAFSAARPSPRIASMSTTARSTCCKAARPTSSTTPNPTWAMPWVARRCSRWSSAAFAWGWAATATLRHVRVAQGRQPARTSTSRASPPRDGSSRRPCSSAATPIWPAPASGDTVGKLVPGACADLIVVDYDPPTPLTATNIDSHILFGVSGRSVRTTIIGGRIAMQDRVLPGHRRRADHGPGPRSRNPPLAAILKDRE